MQKKQPERIICDLFYKKDRPTCTIDPDSPATQSFNRYNAAVNAMYGWLYEQSILDSVCFAFRDYPNETYFAFDVAELLPYRAKMEESGVEDAKLACWRIFDQVYDPCLYSGAIQLGWTMSTYRDNCGCVGRSWEIELVKTLNAVGAGKVYETKEKHGAKAAILHLFKDDGWSNTFTRAFIRVRRRARTLRPKSPRLVKAVV